MAFFSKNDLGRIDQNRQAIIDAERDRNAEKQHLYDWANSVMSRMQRSYKLFQEAMQEMTPHLDSYGINSRKVDLGTPNHSRYTKPLYYLWISIADNGSIFLGQDGKIYYPENKKLRLLDNDIDIVFQPYRKAEDYWRFVKDRNTIEVTVTDHYSIGTYPNLWPCELYELLLAFSYVYDPLTHVVSLVEKTDDQTVLSIKDFVIDSLIPWMIQRDKVFTD